MNSVSVLLLWSNWWWQGTTSKAFLIIPISPQDLSTYTSYKCALYPRKGCFYTAQRFAEVSVFISRNMPVCLKWLLQVGNSTCPRLYYTHFSAFSRGGWQLLRSMHDATPNLKMQQVVYIFAILLFTICVTCVFNLLSIIYDINSANYSLCENVQGAFICSTQHIHNP